jgi:hypothetical protein
MIARLAQIGAARFSIDYLSMLSAFRDMRSIKILVDRDVTWACWPPGLESVLECVMIIPGCELFEQRDHVWYRLLHRVPAFDFPTSFDEAKTIDQVIVPANLDAIAAEPSAPTRAILQLSRDEVVRQTTAMLADLIALDRWVDSAATHELETISASIDGRRVFLVGRRLPTLSDSQRFWGQRIFCPLGFSPDPRLAESSLMALIGLEDSELAILTAERIEIIPRDTLQPLQRSAIRLARKEIGQ